MVDLKYEWRTKAIKVTKPKRVKILREELSNLKLGIQAVEFWLRISGMAEV